MSDLSVVKLPNNTSYNLKDSQAVASASFSGHTLTLEKRNQTTSDVDINNFDTLSVTDLNSGNLINTGSARFINGLYGDITGNADTATTLKNARTIRTNLASTSTASFDGSANITPGVTGTLGVGNGGTGQTTAVNAANAFMNALGTGSSTPTDNDYYISQYVGGGTTTTTYHRRPHSALWSYIQSKINAVLGLNASTYGGKAATAGTADSATSAGKLGTTTVGSAFTPVHFSNGSPVASNGNTIPYIVGTGSTAGTWLGSCTAITEYYDGLLILYKPSIAGASTTTLQINNLAAKTVYVTNTTKHTTHFPVNQPILLVYSASQNSGCWMCLDDYWVGHYTTHLYAGTGTAAHTAVTSGNSVSMVVTDNSTIRDTVVLKGTGFTTITNTKDADNKSTITINTAISNNITGSGTSGYLVKFNGTNTITNGPQLGSATNTFLRNDGTWAAPIGTQYAVVSKTAAGLVPQLPNETTTTKFLRQDGQWAAPSDKDTHLTAHLYVGGSSATGNAEVTTNGNVYLILADNGNYDRRKVAGSGATTVKSDASGNITIASTNTWTAMTGATSSADGTVGYVNSAPPKDGYNTKFLRADGTWAVPPDNNTHNTAYLYAGASNGSANAATTNGNTYLIIKDGSAVSSRNKITGSGATTVTSDANGVITINSTNTWTAMTGATSSANGTVGYVNATPPKDGYNTKYLRADGTWAVPTDTNTHLTGHFYVGASNGTANAATTNGNTYLILADNSNYDRRKISGTAPVTVTSNASGEITIAASGVVTSTPGTEAGSLTQPVYISTTGEATPISYKLNATINTGAANRMAYYSGTNAITYGGNVEYISYSSEVTGNRTTAGNIRGLRVVGTTYGNNADYLASTTVGDFALGDPGPQIQFGTTAGTAKAAIIYTNHDSNGLGGSSFQFVTDEGPINLVAGGIVGRTRAAFGQRNLNTSYTVYNAGTQYANGVLTYNNNITAARTGYGLYLKDSAGISYAGIYDNGSNLWIGATSSTGAHHKGGTYISTGYASDGVTGNLQAFLSIPTNSSGTVSHVARAIAHVVTVGTTTKPVYVDSNGALRPITSYEGNAATATSATSATTASKANAANITTTANAIAYYTNATGTFGSNPCLITSSTGGLEIKGHIAGDASATGHGLQSGGGYHNAYNNLILHGDASTGSSGIAFVSDKITAATGAVTNVNQPTDRAFIQYHACGITTATAEATAPTLGTSGEVGRLVIGIGNDAADQVWLQTPGRTGLIHQVAAASYVIPDTGNTTGTVGSETQPVFVSGGVITACTTYANASVNSAAKFTSAQSITLTGDTTGTASSQAGWSIATTTKRLTNGGRLTSADVDNSTDEYKNKITYFLASSTMTTGKPPTDGGILNFAWDNNKWGGQLAIMINTTPHLYIRGNNNSSWDANWLTVLDSNNYKSYALPLTGGTLTGELISQTGGIWVQGNSAAGGNYNRMTLTSGIPTELRYNYGRRGTRLYSNAIAFADPYNGNSNNDVGWIRHIEETANSGIFEIAVGDDSNESIVVRQYNTSSAVARQAYLLNSSGNTSFPGSVTATSFVGNASSATVLPINQRNNTDIRTWIDTNTNIHTISTQGEMSVQRFFANSSDTSYSTLHLPVVDSQNLIFSIDSTNQYNRILSLDIRTNDAYLTSKAAGTWKNWERIYTDNGGIMKNVITFQILSDTALLKNTYNSTAYNLIRNHNNGNISISASSNGLYLGYENTAFINFMNGRMESRDGCLSIFPNNGNYREGIRIHSYSNWSDITLCGNDNTGNSGTSANSWLIGNNNGNFYITRNGSTGGTSVLSCVSNVWNFSTLAQFNANVTIKGATSASNAYNSTNPKITFSNSDSSQVMQLVMTDYDSVAQPTSLTLTGNQNSLNGGEYFIAPNIRATSRLEWGTHAYTVYNTQTDSIDFVFR